MSILTIVLLVIVGTVLFGFGIWLGKNKDYIPIVLSIVGVGVVCFSAFCISEVNYYYTVQGGVFGVLSNLFGVNQVEGEDLEFSLKNIQLIETGEKYSAKINVAREINFEEETEYIICVNGIPCTTSEVRNNYAVATYEYNFYDKELNIKMTDTLEFSFAFYTNYSELTVSTSGGSEAVRLWNSYFNKNDFVVGIQEGYLTESKVEEADELVTLTYYVNEEYFASAMYPKGVTIKNFTTPVVEGYSFVGWSLDKVNVINQVTMKSDCSLHAILTDKVILFDIANNPGHIIEFKDVNGAVIDIGEYLDVPCDLTGANYSVKFEIGISANDAVYSGNDITTLQNGSTAYLKISNTAIAEVTLTDNIMEIKKAGPVTFFNDILVTLQLVVLYP